MLIIYNRIYTHIFIFTLRTIYPNWYPDSRNIRKYQSVPVSAKFKENTEQVEGASTKGRRIFRESFWLRINRIDIITRCPVVDSLAVWTKRQTSQAQLSPGWTRRASRLFGFILTLWRRLRIMRNEWGKIKIKPSNLFCSFILLRFDDQKNCSLKIIFYF